MEVAIKRIAAPLLLALLVPPAPTPAHALPEGTKVQVYEGGMTQLPVDMAWVPGTRKIFFTEKGSGKIRVMQGRNLLAEPCRDLAVNNDGERGALGIVLDPDYPTNHYLYVYFSSLTQNDNRVVRFTVEDNKCTDRFLVISGIPAGNRHNGGQLEFMDGYLFISNGEVGDPDRAQNTTDLAGKILRINPNGTIPSDNPFGPPGSPNAVWSYGHRNAFGLAVKRDTSQLYETENGPQCGDELNLITQAGNYGWGSGDPETCTAPAGDDPIAPLREWTPTIVPTDPVWYRGRLDAFDESLLMGAYKDGNIRRFRLAPDGESVVGARIVYNGDDGVLDVAKGPGGWVYFLTPQGILRIVEE